MHRAINLCLALSTALLGILYSVDSEAVCAYRYPDFDACSSVGFLGSKEQDGSCLSCGGLCRAFRPASTEVGKELAAASDSEISYSGQVLFIQAAPRSEISTIVIDRAAIASIAQLNPMAAEAIWKLGDAKRSGASSAKNGEIAFSGIPTVETVVLLEQGVAAESVAASMRKNTDAGGSVQVHWTSAMTAAGLEVRFVAGLFDADETLRAQIYPAVRVILRGTGSARSIAEWGVADISGS